MARRRSAPRGFIRPAPRTKMWIGASLAFQVVGASSSVALGSLTAATLLLRPFTVLRSRFRILVRSDQAAVTEENIGAYGDIVVSDQAIAIGTTAIPGPVTNVDAPFFVHEGVINVFNFLSSVGFEEPVGTLIEVDSKAMRKVGPNEDIANMYENLTAVGVRVATAGRTLIQFH